MIKKEIFETSELEKLRILSLHETATKNSYLISEQIKVETRYEPINLGDNFEYGKFDSQTAKSKIKQEEPKIREFIKNNPQENSFVVNITAGESQVTNPKGFEVKGSLALKRAKTVKRYFEEIFPDLIKSGVLTVNVPNTVDEVSIGQTEYKKGGQDLNDETKKKKYKEEQFVKFELQGKGISLKTEFCKTQFNSVGGFLTSQANYTAVVDVDLGRGEGNFTVSGNTFQMPDILYFHYNGKSIGSSVFKGSTDDHFRIFLGTSLRAKFKDGPLPGQFNGNTYIPLKSDDPRIVKALPAMREWKLFDSFSNTFGSNDSSIPRYNYMEHFATFDKTGDIPMLLKNLGPKFPWGYVNSQIDPPTFIEQTPIMKVAGKDSIKYINVAPVGTTRWTAGIYCIPKK